MSVDENGIFKGLSPEAGRTPAAASPRPSRDPCRPTAGLRQCLLRGIGDTLYGKIHLGAIV